MKSLDLIEYYILIFLFISILIFEVFFRFRRQRGLEKSLNEIVEKQNIKLKMEEERIKFALEAADVEYWDWNLEDGKVYTDEKFGEFLGYSRKELGGDLKKWFKLVHKEDRKNIFNSWRAYYRGEIGKFENEYRIKNKEKEWAWIKTIGKIFERDEAGKPLRVIGINMDITYLKNQEMCLKRLTNIDYLTGAYNRKFFMETLNNEVNKYDRDDGEFIVALLDMDFFKKINDEYGHLAGDYILKKIVEIINLNIRKYDVLARYGGEEFIILFPKTEKEKALSIVSRIKKIVEDHEFRYDDNTMKITFSMGLASPKDLEECFTDDLLLLVDNRLYMAKSRGRNCIVSES